MAATEASLKTLTVRAYNSQFHKTTKEDDFEFITLETEATDMVAYELRHLTHTNLRLRTYLTDGNFTNLSAFNLAIDNDVVAKGELGDEVLVATGTISPDL